jgi:histidinol-phosphatase
VTASLLRAAALAADVGAAVALRRFAAHELPQWLKDDGSRVTAADFAAEDAIRNRLAELTPGIPVFGEETGGDKAAVDRWIVDPIDGTENFSRGNPVWATLVAFESRGTILASAVSAPALQGQWTAARGMGAFAGHQRLRVSTRAARHDSTFCYGGLHECPSPAAADRLVAVAASFRCAWGWGNFWGHVQVAQGSAEAALSYGVELWDLAALSLLVDEAGGRSTDLAGRGYPQLGSLLTANCQLHQDLLQDLAVSMDRRPSTRGEDHGG